MHRTSINTAVTISKRSNDTVHIVVTDTDANVAFLDLSLSLEQLASALTGLAHVSCTSEVRGLNAVGKVRVREPRSIVRKTDGYPRREDHEQWLRDNCAEEGWQLDTYLGAQRSVRSVPGGYELNYAAVKYVDKSDVA